MSWPVVALGNFCDLKNGYAFKSNDYVDNSNTLNCRMSNIRPGGYFDIEYSPKYLPDEYAEKYSEFLLQDGDVVIAMTDLASAPKILGVPTIVKTNGKNILLNQRVGKLIIKDESLIHLPYLQQALNYPKIRETYKKFAGGGLQINVGKADVLSVRIPLPPLSEQKRIATILDKADAIRRKRQQAIQLADEFLRSVFLDMFGPQCDLPRKPLDELTNSVEYGLTASAKNSGDGPKLLRITDIQNDNVNWKDVPLCDCSLADERKYQLEPGDIVFARTGATTGKSFLIWDCPDRAVFASYLIRVRPADQLDPIFLSHFFKSRDYWSQVASLSQGAAQPGINGTKLKSLSVPIPDIGLQKKFRCLVEKVVSLQDRHDKSMNNSADLFSSFSQRAFRGDL